MTKRMCMVPSLITKKEEVRTYCVFVQWGQGAGALSVQVSFFIHDVVRAHVRVIQTVSVSSCGARKHTQTMTLGYNTNDSVQTYVLLLDQNRCSGGNERHNRSKKKRYPWEKCNHVESAQRTGFPHNSRLLRSQCSSQRLIFTHWDFRRLLNFILLRYVNPVKHLN